MKEKKKTVEKGEDPSPSHFQLTGYDAFFCPSWNHNKNWH
jgi:hypothetical protein